MIYQAYQLKAYLTHLILDADKDGAIEFIGTDAQYKRALAEINNYENN